ncbi:MAG: hypothetical protein K5768_10270 [Firmicutes bacterium]|nr:hypothetical protein [Bacillota bacterium]
MEVYGVKPKRFTKEWWEYFWEYYKWHTIATIVLIILFITSINDCVHRINYDLQVDYISEHQISEEASNALTALIEENIDDVTENGKKEAYVTLLDMKENPDPQYTQAMYTKYSVEMAYIESFVFLMSKKYADELSDMGVFEASENWTSAPSYNGYCISLEDCTALKEIGIDTGDLYLGIIKLKEQEKVSEREKKLLQQENGIKFAKFLISKR